MEKYLETDYNVYEDKKYLQSEADIEPTFKDIGEDYLPCGQGYSTSVTDVICKIGERFFSVHICGSIGSSNQELGDRLYWVEAITHISYKEIPKPLPKTKQVVMYGMEITAEQKQKLEKFMVENNIEFRS